jgi:phage baseplate assembly protein W
MATARTSPIVASDRVYADFDLSMLIHPNTADIIPLKDTDAVKQSIRNIILTSHGEKLFKPKFGGRAAEFLFENVSPFTALALKAEIEDVIRLHEPRVSNVAVTVTDNADSNAYDISIAFLVINININDEVSFELKRLR